MTETVETPGPFEDTEPVPLLTEQRTESGIILPTPEGKHIGAISFINGRTSPFAIEAPHVLKRWHTRDPMEVVEKVAEFIHRTVQNPRAAQMLSLIDPMYGFPFWVTVQGMREAQTVGHGWANEVDPNAVAGQPQILRVPASALSQFSGGPVTPSA